MKDIIFEKTAQNLIEGKVICSETTVDCYKYLEVDENFYKVSSFFDQMGRTLKSTENKNAYYLAYKDIDKENRSKIASVFSKTRKQFQPIVYFIYEIMNIKSQDYALAVGDSISLSYVEKKVEQRHDLKNRMNELYKLVSQSSNAKRDTIRSKLEFIFKHMEKEGILYQINKEESIYSITGKIELIYELMAYINENEKIVPESEL